MILKLQNMETVTESVGGLELHICLSEVCDISKNARVVLSSEGSRSYTIPLMLGHSDIYKFNDTVGAYVRLVTLSGSSRRDNGTVTIEVKAVDLEKPVLNNYKITLTSGGTTTIQAERFERDSITADFYIEKQLVGRFETKFIVGVHNVTHEVEHIAGDRPFESPIEP